MKRVYAGPEDGVEIQLPDGSHRRIDRDAPVPAEVPARLVAALEASGHKFSEPKAAESTRKKKAAAAAKEA